MELTLSDHELLYKGLDMYYHIQSLHSPRNVRRRRQWHPTPVLLPRKSHGQRSLVGCSLWGRWELDMTERLHFHFSLSCIGEGNGNPFQCSCLENPGDGGAWWAAVYGVAQSQTRLKHLSSSSSRRNVRAQEGLEELSHVEGQEGRRWGDTPRPR